MSGPSDERAKPPLVEAALLTARLSAAERQTLFAALADAGEVAGALRYLRQTPALLSGGLDLQDFYKNLGLRWQTTAEVARDICALYSLTANDTVAREKHSGLAPPAVQTPAQPPPAPEPSPPPSASPVASPASPAPPRNDGDQLDPGTSAPTPPPDHGDQATPTLTLLNAGQMDRLRQWITSIQAQALAENLEPTELRAQVGALAQGLENFEDEEQQTLVRDAWSVVQALSDEQLLNLLTLDPQSDESSLAQIAPYAEGVGALSVLLQARATAAELAAEINRLRGPGFKWTFPALQKQLQSLGYEGPDISDPDVIGTLDLGQAGNVLGYLRSIRSAHRPGRKVAPVSSDPGAPARASLSKRKERIEYIEQLLDRSSTGVVYTNELSEPFGVNGTSVSSLLREFGYEAIGGGGYRRKRNK